MTALRAEVARRVGDVAMNGPERQSITAYLWGELAVLTCPCHLLILAVVLAGTTAGTFLGEHLGYRGARFDRPVSSIPVAGVAGIRPLTPYPGTAVSWAYPAPIISL